jgi:hypothetical protein
MHLPLQRTGSLKLGRTAHKALIWGIFSIFFGWTIIVPIISFCYCVDTSAQAKLEQVPNPTRATVAVILTILFGLFYGLSLLIHLSH